MRDILKNKVKTTVPGNAHPIYELLCTYYDGEIYEGIELDDIESEIYLPLKKRPSGILEALEMLMPMEEDINDESTYTPLMMSVLFIDYYMTEYLIEHGANPNYWWDREEDIREHEMLGTSLDNFYLEDIDTRILLGLDISNKLVVDNIIRLVKLILEYDGVESFFGLCLCADKDNRKIKIGSPQYMY